MKFATKSTVLGVALMAVLLAVYLTAVAAQAVTLLLSGALIAVVMGAALLVLPLIGIWALVRELLFGARAQQLLTRLETEGELPPERVSVLASGRPVREEADALFDRYRDAALTDESNWRAWMRLGLVYDACGDRRRARQAVNRAIRLSQSRT